MLYKNAQYPGRQDADATFITPLGAVEIQIAKLPKIML